MARRSDQNPPEPPYGAGGDAGYPQGGDDWTRDDLEAQQQPAPPWGAQPPPQQAPEGWYGQQPTGTYPQQPPPQQWQQAQQWQQPAEPGWQGVPQDREWYEPPPEQWHRQPPPQQPPGGPPSGGPPPNQPPPNPPPPGDSAGQESGDGGSQEPAGDRKRDKFLKAARTAAVASGKGLHVGARYTARYTRQAGAAADSKLTEMVGGEARKRVIVLLAAVLALSGADIGVISAAQKSLTGDLSISNSQIGLLISVVALSGGVATLPIGKLIDRVNRTRVLAISVVLWAVGMAACAFAPDYWWLLLTRVGLGVVVAVAQPAIASLTGDLFFPHERGKVLGFILAGEFIGTGLGYAVAGLVTAVFPWRVVFVVFAIPAIALFIAVWRIKEPKRGGQDRMEPVEPPSAKHRVKKEADERSVHDRVKEAGITPTPAALLDEDPAAVPLIRSVRYLLKIPSNVALIVSSALGYFFFAGLKLYATRFIGEQFELGNVAVSVIFPLIGIGAILGMVLGGRFADWMVSRGKLSSRMVIGACGYLLVPLLLPIVLLSQNFLIAFPILLLVAAGLAWPNPVLDAARLDVVEHRLWGRAESLRTLLRTGAETLAPWLFGLLVDVIANHSSEKLGFRWTFAIMLVPLLASGIVLLRARKHYVGDVAAAALTEERFVDPEDKETEVIPAVNDR